MEKLSILTEKINDFFNVLPSQISDCCDFIKRQRKLRAESFLKALIFGNLQDGESSIESMCQILGEEYIDISKQGFHFRFKEESVNFMKLMFDKAMKLFQGSMEIKCVISYL